MQRRVLEILEEDPGAWASAFLLAEVVYDVKPGADGMRVVTDAQLSAVRRALMGLYKLRKVSRDGYTSDHRTKWTLGDGTTRPSDRSIAREIVCSPSSVSRARRAIRKAQAAS